MTGAESAYATASARAERLRRRLPEALKTVTQIAVDNPGQCLLMLAAAVTITAAARNLVRPRTLAEALALAVVLDVGCSWAAAEAIDRGILTFRLRDADGQLAPWRPGIGGMDAGSADPAG
jgi:hypothetical protein